MTELASSPYQKETFELTNPSGSAESREKAKNNTRLFREAMARLRDSQDNEIRHGRYVSASQAGAEAGKCLVRYLSSHQDNPDVLKPVKTFVSRILPPPRAGEFISGFVGEYAFAHFLVASKNRIVKYPETDEDRKLQVDWIVADPGKPEAYVQTKVLPLADEQVEDARLVYDISNPAVLEEMEENLYSYRFKREISIGDYIRRAEEMAQANQGADKQLIFCLIPSGEISVVSGTFVNRDFQDKMRSELENVGL